MKMKNLLTLIVAFVAVVAFSSCKKDYTCDCTVYNQEVEIELENYSKGDATDACASAETSYKVGDPNAVCTLD